MQSFPLPKIGTAALGAVKELSDAVLQTLLESTETSSNFSGKCVRVFNKVSPTRRQLRLRARIDGSCQPYDTCIP